MGNVKTGGSATATQKSRAAQVFSQTIRRKEKLATASTEPAQAKKKKKQSRPRSRGRR
jgi:hypothetical protein